MIGGGGGAGFQNIQVLLSANNTNLKSVLTQSSAGIKAFDRTVEKSNVNLGKSGNLLGNTLAGGALAAAAGLAYAAGKAADFDKAMRNVNSLAGLGETGFAALEKRVISMSTRLPQSAQTLAEGLYDIQSSGFSGADGMKVLESAALSASAGLTTTEVSARAISAVLNSYGLQAKDAADVSDVLFQTVNAGVISFDELAGNLGDVVGGAAAAKVEIDEVGSAIAAMTLAGIGGAESTTSLNALLQKLIQPSNALRKLYSELGYESGEAAIEQDGLRGVMEKVRVATGGNITALLELFPEIRAARGALALMANEGDNYARTAAQIEDKNARAGAAQRVFNEQMKAASNQFSLLKNQADAVAITVGLRLLPMLIQLMDGARDAGSAFGDLTSMLGQQFGPGMDDLGQILANLWDIFVGLGAAVWNLVEPFAKLAVGGVAAGFNTLMAVLEPLTNVLAENEGAATVLAVALGVHLAGGAAAAASALGWNLVLALVKTISGLGTAAAAARTAGTALMAAAPGIALVAAISGGVIAWQSYNRAVEDVKDANHEVQKSFDQFDMDGVEKGISTLQKQYAELKKNAEDVANTDGVADLAEDLLNLSENFRTLGLINEDVEGKLQAAEDQLSNFRSSAIVLMGVLDETGASQADLNRLMEDMNGWNGPEAQTAAFEQLDAVISKFGPKLTKLGADFSNGIQAEDIAIVQDYMASLGGTTMTTAQAQDNLVDKLGAVDTAMGNTAEAADALDTALDELMGASMGVDAAGIAWRQGLADLTKGLRDSKAGIVGNSLAAGENRMAIQGQIERMQDLLVAQAKNGAGSRQLTSSLMRSRDALIAAGRAANIPAASMRALLRQYKLTPQLVQTLIREHGGKNVKSMLRDIQREADKTDKKKPTIPVGVLTAKGKKDLRDMQKQSELLGLQKPKIKPEAPTEKAESQLKKLGKTADATDKKKADIPTSAPGATAAESAIRGAGAAADDVDGKRVVITTEHRSIHTGKQANGGYYPLGQFADGGFSEKVLTSTTARLPQQAKIQSGSGAGLVQWAEGETGGEAFIPLSETKRGRSMEILEQVASQFGYQLAEMESFAGGGFRGKKKGETAKEYAAAKKDHAEEQRAKAKERRERAMERAQERRERQRLLHVIHGRGEGRFRPDVTGNPQKSMANLDAAMEARAQAKAELAARRSKNKNDTAEDFYKKPVVGVKDYIKALQASQHAAAVWGKDTSRISKEVGGDVVASLKGMGEDGEKWIKKLADASVRDMKKMAAELRKLQFVEFHNGLTQDIAAQQAFAGNLAALIRMGRGDLAAQLGEMGYQNAGGIAAHAVTMNAGELSQLAGQMAQQDAISDPAMMDAVTLAGLLQGSSRPLGLIGLTNASGKPVGDVVGLLMRYEKEVFGQVPAGRMAQIRADQELLRAGKQPSGLEYGGIVPGSKTSDSLYYRWAEKNSGGESLIPHGQDRRQRALAIWEQTGRIIGARTGGGGGTMVTVSPGAVAVDVKVSGTNLSPADVQRAATAAANSAMDRLATKLQSGKR